MPVEEEETSTGLTEAQVDVIYGFVCQMIESMKRPRSFHFALFVLLRGDEKDDDANGVSLTGTNVVSSLDSASLHEVLRFWLHKETQ